MFARCSLGLLIAMSAVAAGCGTSPDEILQQARVKGSSGTLGGALVEAWATFEPGGAVSSVGATLPVSAVEQASGAQELVLDLPSEIKQTTFLDHLRIAYNPKGQHPSGVYAGEQVSFQFFGIDRTERQAIDCADEPVPTTTTLPSSYTVAGTAAVPDGACVPGFGLYAFANDAADLSAAFSSTLVLGYHQGNLAFVEPVAATGVLEDRHDFGFEMPALQLLGEGTLFPGSVVGQYDPSSDSYAVFVERFAATQ